MRRRIFITFTALLSVHFLSAAEPRWTRMATPNFEMFTTSGERSARDTLRYFEQVRSIFAQTMPHSSAAQARVRIVAFNSLKEYEPYRPNNFAIAYYSYSGDHEYIVMSHTGAETFPIAIHEYVHLVVRHSRVNLPPWLNEGLAELYSSLRPMGDKVLVGAIIPGRYQALFRDKWVPLEIILRADQNSPYYNEKDQAGSLYNEGWALTHMLELNEDYRPKFADFIKLIAAGTDSVTALEQTYREPVRQLESELQRYLRAGSFNGILLPAKLEKSVEELHAEPADPFEVKLLLAEVGNQTSHHEAARAAFEELIKENPQRPEPHLDLGYLDWQQHDNASARRQFETAFDLGSRNERMLWDFARMEEGADATKSAAAMNELLKQQPDRLEVRFELAALQIRAQTPRAALDALAPVKHVTAEQAPRLFLLMAQAHLAAGNRDEARKSAERLQQVAKSDNDRRYAAQVLNYLDRSSAPPERAAASPDGAPVIRRRTAPTFEVRENAPQNHRASFTGQFVELQCATPARIILQTAEGRKTLLIDDPTRLMVNGNNGETMDLSCGRQKPRNVSVEYDDPQGRAGIDGIARAIHFAQ